MLWCQKSNIWLNSASCHLRTSKVIPASSSPARSHASGLVRFSSRTHQRLDPPFIRCRGETKNIMHSEISAHISWENFLWYNVDVGFSSFTPGSRRDEGAAFVTRTGARSRLAMFVISQGAGTHIWLAVCQLAFRFANVLLSQSWPVRPNVYSCKVAPLTWHQVFSWPYSQDFISSPFWSENI